MRTAILISSFLLTTSLFSQESYQPFLLEANRLYLAHEFDSAKVYLDSLFDDTEAPDDYQVYQLKVLVYRGSARENIKKQQYPEDLKIAADLLMSTWEKYSADADIAASLTSTMNATAISLWNQGVILLDSASVDTSYMMIDYSLEFWEAIGNNVTSYRIDAYLAIADQYEILYQEAFDYEDTSNFHKARVLYDNVLTLDSTNILALSGKSKLLSLRSKIQEENIYQIEQGKELAELKSEEESRKVKEREQLIYLAIGGLIILFVIVYLLYRSNSIKKSKNILLKDHSSVLEEKNKEITDSIKYASRIQSGVLPSDNYLSQKLDEYFILYKPKDILAGDFYWLEEKNQSIYFTAADCTGHGVPGAIVSVMCSGALSRALKELDDPTPAALLHQVETDLEEQFKRSEEVIKDGMDLGLCRINLSKMEVEFAGANNPMYLIRNGELTEYKGDKEGIGYSEHHFQFNNVKLELKKGDLIYLLTDGYADQFGGEHLPNGKAGGKKFKYKRLKELLINLHQKPMTEQGQELDSAFEEWRGSLEQVDDVCIIGVRI